jgi:glycosyltransferase involved in cell wall biosynthesis
VRILFANHTGVASGAEYALVRLVQALRERHRVAVACPKEGSLADLMDEAAVQRLNIPAFEASLRPDPVRMPIYMGRLAAGGLMLARAARRFDADVIHANTPRAGLMGAVARRAGGPPLVVRAHESLPATGLGRPVRRVLERSASAILTVSQDIAGRFNEGAEEPVATHVYNSFDRQSFDPAWVEAAGVRAELGIAPGAFLVGQVAQITPWKGQDTSIRALAEVRRRGLDCHLLIVGGVLFRGKGVRYDNEAYLAELHRLVAELGVGDSVHFLGLRDDVPGILKELDLSLLPSWDEPFANVMLESMSMGTPLLVSDVGGGPELVEDGISGRLLPPKRPEAWADAMYDLLQHPLRLALMSQHSRQATAGFTDDVHAREMLYVYERVLEEPDGGPAAVARALALRRCARAGARAPAPARIAGEPAAATVEA